MKGVRTGEGVALKKGKNRMRRREKTEKQKDKGREGRDRHRVGCLLSTLRRWKPLQQQLWWGGYEGNVVVR